MVLSLDRWIGKVAIVTGTSSGIGEAIAIQLVSHGIIVVGVARRVERVQDLAKKLSSQKGKLHAVKADFSKEEDILTTFKWVKENLGPVHVLINNAGVVEHSSLTEGKTEDWKKVFNLNVLGLSIATREAVKDMRANNIDGHIIHINSIAGHTVLNLPGLGPYPASKFAVTALTETLRQEFNHLGAKIKITSVSPGGVDTEIVSRNAQAFESVRKGEIPILQSEDIADGVVYVLSTPPHVQVHELIIKPVGEHF